MKHILIILNLFVLACVGQTIAPSVINSAGKSVSATLNAQPIIYSDNIGEAIIGTASNSTKMLTQGFLQPTIVDLGGGTVTTYSSDVTCADKGDGVIRIDIKDPHSTADIKYYWIPDTLCPTHDCPRMDSLSKGIFTVITVITYTPIPGGAAKTESTTSIVEIKDNFGPCDIKVYTGISLSSGTNTKFTIDNIELYPEAKVCIYTRWGNQIFCTDKYSNTRNYWPKDGEKVMPGTYFFIIDLGEKGLIKKWIEVFE